MPERWSMGELPVEIRIGGVGDDGFGPCLLERKPDGTMVMEPLLLT